MASDSYHGRNLTRGEDKPNAKLTDDDVRLMRQLKIEEIPIRVIAEKFEITYSTAWKAITYRSWKHVK